MSARACWSAWLDGFAVGAAVTIAAWCVVSVVPLAYREPELVAAWSLATGWLWRAGSLLSAVTVTALVTVGIATGLALWHGGRWRTAVALLALLTLLAAGAIGAAGVLDSATWLATNNERYWHRGGLGD